MTGAFHQAGLMDEARQALESASRLALRAGGADFEACQVPLESARGRFDEALAAPGRGAEDASRARMALDRVRRELRTFTALHEQAAAFYFGWASLVADLEGQAYAPRSGAGLPVRVTPGRRVSLEA
jgi:hypothetical protein